MVFTLASAFILQGWRCKPSLLLCLIAFNILKLPGSLKDLSAHHFVRYGIFPFDCDE
jgi:hypothetical protein